MKRFYLLGLIFLLCFGAGLAIGEIRVQKLRKELKDINQRNEAWVDKVTKELKKMWEGDDLK